jgi:MSHA biogenesis protein MshO
MTELPTEKLLFGPRRALTQVGFTMIELIVVIVVLGIVSVSMGGIIRNSMNTVITVSERENLVRDGSFLVERLNRELSASVPNSVRIKGNALVHCIEFVPMLWNAVYLTLPLAGEASDIVDLVELNDMQGRLFMPSVSDFAIVYPTSSLQVYDASLGHRRNVVSCSDDDNGDCSTLDDSDHVIQLEVNDGFAQTSPSRRLYFAQTAVSYCMRDAKVFRHVGSISENQSLYNSGGSLMAQNLVNLLAVDVAAGDQSPFRIQGATLNRNASSQTLFIFGRGNERVTFMQEVQIPNVP